MFVLLVFFFVLFWGSNLTPPRSKFEPSPAKSEPGSELAWGVENVSPFSSSTIRSTSWGLGPQPDPCRAMSLAINSGLSPLGKEDLGGAFLPCFLGPLGVQAGSSQGSRRMGSLGGSPKAFSRSPSTE